LTNLYSYNATVCVKVGLMTGEVPVVTQQTWTAALASNTESVLDTGAKTDGCRADKVYKIPGTRLLLLCSI